MTEHGVTSLLKDIKQNFPNSRLLPALINRNATYAEVVNFTKKLYEHCTDCLLVASVDFSHSEEVRVADLHDKLALRGLFELRSELLYKEAEVDSPESLVALTVWAKLHGSERFELFSHTNSGFLSGLSSGEMTTHIIGGYVQGEKISTDDFVTFMIGGDLSLSRGVDEVIKSRPKVLDKLGDRFFWGADVTLVNLEGYFTNEPNPDEWKLVPPILSMSSAYITYLKRLRLNTVSLANNHANDGGAKGLAQTVAILAENNIAIIGDNADIIKSTVRVEEFGEVKVAFVSVYTHESFSGLIDAITELSRTGHYVVVCAHWGVEYSQKAGSEERNMAKDWIDAGADLVVGSHPHVVQEVEVYRGRPIVYSLGNFWFDQGFAEEVMVGAVLGGMFENDKLSIFLVPVNSYLEPAILTGEIYSQLLEKWTQNLLPHKQTNGYFSFDLSDDI